MRRFFLLSCFLLGACTQDNGQLALGTLERDRIAHTATVNEVVVELPIAQGTAVVKGDILVRLDDTHQRAQVSKAQAEISQAKAELDKLQAGAREEEIAVARAKVAGSKAKLVESEATYKRAQHLVKNKLSSQADLDQALAARDSHRANLHRDEEELRLLIKGTREEELRMAQARLESTQAILAVENKKLQDLTIRATRDGMLDNLPWNLGERVTTGSPLAIVLAGRAPFARVYVPEPYRVKLQVNDTLMIHIDGLDVAYQGRLRWISNEPAFTPYYALNQQERAHLMYLAEIQLPDTAGNLPNGIPVQVELP